MDLPNILVTPYHVMQEMFFRYYQEVTTTGRTTGTATTGYAIPCIGKSTVFTACSSMTTGIAFTMEGPGRSWYSDEINSKTQERMCDYLHLNHLSRMHQQYVPDYSR